MTDVTELFRTVGMVDVKADITGMTGDLGEIVIGVATDTDELCWSTDGGSTWTCAGAVAASTTRWEPVIFEGEIVLFNGDIVMQEVPI